MSAKKIKKIEISLIIGFILTLIIQNFISVAKTESSIQSNILRFHILANSDSDEDQNIKIKIRDEIINASKEENWFENCDTIEKTKTASDNYLKTAQKIADNVLKENGFDYLSKAEIVYMDFEERKYDDISVPSGNYLTFRISLGEGEGHNWWCVLYPQMCLPCAQEVSADEQAIDEFFDDDEIDMLYNPEKYRFRLKCVEIFRKLLDK
jgi:stage II sporulation protein R